jgi:DNA-binding beta-propeller fold protein YncE
LDVKNWEVGEMTGGQLATRMVAGLAGMAIVVLSVPASASAYSVYVANTGSESISQFTADSTTGLLTPKSPATVATGAGTFPNEIALTPDGKNLYVTSQVSQSVVMFDVDPAGSLSLKSPTSSVPLPPGDPTGIVVSPDGASAYVSVDGAVNDIAMFDVSASGVLSSKATPTVNTPSVPDAIIVSPDGQNVYTVNRDAGSNNIAIFDVGAGGVLTADGTTLMNGVNLPEGIAMTPNGNHVYASGSANQTLYFFDRAAGGGLTPNATPSLMNNNLDGPAGMAVSPNGQFAYVAGDGDEEIGQLSVAGSGALAYLNPDLAPTGAGTVPREIAISPDGQHLYVSDDDGTTGAAIHFPIASTGTLGTPTPAATQAMSRGIAISPDQPPVASFTATPAPAGFASSFDGSASTDAQGSIVRYEWDFGDGATASGAEATTTHIYSSPGTYTARLTVIDSAGCGASYVSDGKAVYCNGSASGESGRTTTRQVVVSGGTNQNAGFTIVSTTKKKNGTISVTIDPVTGGLFEAKATTRIRTGRPRGRSEVARRRITYGSTSLSLNTPSRVTLTIKPSRRAKRALAQGQRLRVNINVTQRAANGTTDAKSARVVVKRKRKRR